MTRNELTTEQAASFERQVRDLFEHARWDSRKIAKWAASAASGFGMLTEEEAHALILPIVKKLNAEQDARNRAARKEFRESMADIAALARRTGFTFRIR
jgi:hypothetical protein